MCVLTSCSNVGRHASAGPDAGGGHTLVSAHSEISKGGDVERTGPHQHSQTFVAPSWQLSAIQTPADVDMVGQGAAAQGHAAPQFLYHRERLLGEDWDVI